MNCRRSTIAAVVSAVCGCALQTSPIPDERNDVLQYVLVAPVPLSRAILAAEERTVGKAIKGELVRRSGKMLYQVLVTAQGDLKTVTVDPVKGHVLEVRP